MSSKKVNKSVWVVNYRNITAARDVVEQRDAILCFCLKVFTDRLFTCKAGSSCQLQQVFHILVLCKLCSTGHVHHFHSLSLMTAHHHTCYQQQAQHQQRLSVAHASVSAVKDHTQTHTRATGEHMSTVH